MDFVNEIVMPFVRVTTDCFDSMIGTKLKLKNVEKSNNRYKARGVYAMISFTGDMSGTIAISFQQDTALKIFSRFLEESITEIDDEACDAAGEIINIIAGGKSYVSNYNMNMSLPSVLIGSPMLIALPRDVPVIKVTFVSSEVGEVSLLVSLRESR